MRGKGILRGKAGREMGGSCKRGLTKAKNAGNGTLCTPVSNSEGRAGEVKVQWENANCQA